MQLRNPEEDRASPLRNALDLFALSGFAIGQPLFDALARFPEFFVSHRAQPGEIQVFVALVLVVPPVLAWSVEVLAHLVDRRLGWGVHLLLVAGMLTAVALPPLVRGTSLPAAVIAATAGAAAAAATLAYARWKRLRGYVGLLAIAPLVFAAHFVTSPGVARLLFHGGTGELLSHDVPARSPVVVVVFDELALTSLLASDGGIDPVRAPAFARLGEQATWYRNATAVHTSTFQAVSAILTGDYPDPSLMPILSDHPRNLFSLLESRYDMHVVESETMLYRGSRPTDDDAGDGRRRLATLLSDTRYVYLHLVLPSPWRSSLPAVDRAWKNFAEQPREQRFAEQARQTIWVDYDEPSARFERFIAEIEPCRERCLHFIHTMLPHHPWELLPSGRRYKPDTTHGLREREHWGEEAWEVAEGYQQHLLQVGAADRLLGLLLDRLEALDLYDRSLVVVTADHGLGFWPGESMRRFESNSHPEDLIHVPLLVKVPGQRTPDAVERRVEAIDVLPTIAEALEMPLPWPVDGCAASGSSCPERSRITTYDQKGQRLHLEPEILERTQSLARKFSLFPSPLAQGLPADAAVGVASPAPLWPYRLRVAELGDAATAWLGQSVGDAPGPAIPSWTVTLTRLPIDRAIEHPATDALGRLSGSLRVIDGTSTLVFTEPPLLAISIDGTVEAVVPAIDRGLDSLRFSALLPEQRLGPGRHQIGVHRIAGDGSDTHLEPLLVEWVVVPRVDSDAGAPAAQAPGS